jgi:BirA family biotin operon repressor/biotin-[acetyl-CoA-carboxylase] ligase
VGELRSDDLLERLTPELRALGGRFAAQYEHHQTLDSTNDRLSAWRAEKLGALHGALVTAEAQRKGRGRMGRPWLSEGGDIYASLLCLPAITGELRPGIQIGALGLAVGLALAEGVEAACEGRLEVHLKWPNDLVVLRAGALEGRRKLGGILVETRWLGAEPEIVIGFGINVGRSTFAGELADIATSLEMELGDRRPGRAAVLAHCLARLEAVNREFFSGGFPAIRADYMRRCINLDQEVWVPSTRPDGSSTRILARVVTLEEDGALRVKSAGGGPAFRIESADVWLASPSDDSKREC